MTTVGAVAAILWTLQRVALMTFVDSPKPFFMQSEFRYLQDFSILIGTIAGSSVTSLFSLGREISRTFILSAIILGLIIFSQLTFGFGTFMDVPGAIVLLLVTPTSWLVATLVKKRVAAT